MTNAQNTLVRLWLASLERHARTVSHDLTDEEEAREWDAIKECLEAKAINPQAPKGDTWTLVVLGYRSPSWLLGIQRGAAEAAA